MTVTSAFNAKHVRPDHHDLAYDLVSGTGPTVVFLHGLKSDRHGTKADVLIKHCEDRGYGFLRFDMYGHGQSTGVFEDGTISRWVADAIALISELTHGPVVLVGSSMGGWVALKTAMALPARLAGFIGIAAAPDFTEDLMWAELSDAQRATLMQEGMIELPSEYDTEPYRINRALIEDGRKNLVLRDEISISCPVRLLHGQRDTSVPWQLALTLAEQVAADDVQTILIKDGDHRLSRAQDLKLLCDVLDDVVDAGESMRALVLAGLLVATPVLAQVPRSNQGTPAPDTLDPAKTYALCLDSARAYPEQGVEFAGKWVGLGGGEPAKHCQAVAFMGLREYGEAADALGGTG